MKRREVGALGLLITLWLGLGVPQSNAQNGEEIRNVVLMITDGTSLPTVSLARWYQRMLHPEMRHLNIDPYLCGTVITFCSDAPTGDSASTTSCYVNGMPSNTGFVSTYPRDAGASNLVPVDTARQYAPLITLLEAARLERGMRTGLVVTCQFPHATPADCSAHGPKRTDYARLAKQMVHNHIDVMIGGGTGYLDSSMAHHLRRQGYEVLQDDLQGLRKSHSNHMWALFNPKDLPYELDRDSSRYPSLAESTRIALKKLSDGNPKGFFLMVEGSKVDWAAHDNDLAALPTEFLGFDAACHEVLEFAKRDGHTAVIITADHGNSGVSIGRQSWPLYDEYSKEELFGQLMRFRHTGEWLANALENTPPARLDSLFQQHCGFTLTDNDREALYLNRNYRLSPIPTSERMAKDSVLYRTKLARTVSAIMSARTPIAFTTHGHTAEEVFLACYHPGGKPPKGVIYNTDLHRYMAGLLGWPNGVDSLNQKYFIPHPTLFKGMKTRILHGDKKGEAMLEVKSRKHTLRAYENVDWVELDGQRVELGSLVVFSPERQLFYGPQPMRALVE